MKFSLASTVLFSIGLFAASCSAACDCKATDQACLDKCVMAANSCIVKCENQGDSCQEACITSNWPSALPQVQKDVLAEANSNLPGGATATGTATGTGASAGTATETGAVATASGVMSGISSVMATGTLSSGGSARASGSSVPTGKGATPKNNIDTNSTNSSSSADRQKAMIGWSVAMVAVAGSVSWIM